MEPGLIFGNLWERPVTQKLKILVYIDPILTSNYLKLSDMNLPVKSCFEKLSVNAMSMQQTV